MQEASPEVQHLLDLAQVSKVLPDNERVTVFAPSNDALVELMHPYPANVAEVPHPNLNPSMCETEARLTSCSAPPSPRSTLFRA